jgi:hypothetical protein
VLCSRGTPRASRAGEQRRIGQTSNIALPRTRGARKFVTGGRLIQQFAQQSPELRLPKTLDRRLSIHRSFPGASEKLLEQFGLGGLG